MIRYNAYIIHINMATSKETKTTSTVIPLYSIQEEHANIAMDGDQCWDAGTNLPANLVKPPPHTCCLCLFRQALRFATLVLGSLTFIFALLVAPFAIWVGQPPSNVKLKHAIREIGGSFITWGPKNEYILEYFIYGSKDPNADVMLIYAGALSPGTIWGNLAGDQSANVWGQILGIKLICPSNPGIGCSSLPKGRLLTRDDVVNIATRLLSKEQVKKKIFVAGMSQGAHAAGVIADRLSARIKGALFMCPYMPMDKAHELFFQGKKIEGDSYLDTPPQEIPLNVLFDVFPSNLIVGIVLRQLLPIVNHSFNLFSVWSGFTRRNLGLSPDMLAASQRCDAEGNSIWIDRFLSGTARGGQYNMYGEANIIGFGNYKNMAGKDGTTPVVICTDRNENEIPDILCSSRQSWWMVDQIPSARLLTCDMGYGHFTEYLFCHELMFTALPVLRKEYQTENQTENQTAAAATTSKVTYNDIASSVHSRRSGTSARTRFRKRREDIWEWTDPTKTCPPSIHKNSPIPWQLRRESGGAIQLELSKWVTFAFVAQLHFGFVFLAILFSLSYSYTAFVVWSSVGIPVVVCVTGAIILGPMLLANLMVAARHQDPSSLFRIVLNSAAVIQQGTMHENDNKNTQVHLKTGEWSFQGVLIFIIWVTSNGFCVYFLNNTNFMVPTASQKVAGGVNITDASAAPLVAVPVWIQIWHVLASIMFALVLAHLTNLMSIGLRAISMSSGDIVSRMKTWSPPRRGERSVLAMSNTLPMIATDISLFDESVVGGYSLFFDTTMHSILLATFAFIAAIVVAVVEDRTWLTLSRDVGVAVLGLLAGFGVLCSKALSTMAATTSLCSHIPLSTNRLRLRVVEAMNDVVDDDQDGNDADSLRWLQSVSESVRALCDGVLAHQMGFRLSGFIVSKKMVMQVLYAFASILFLLLAGGRTGTRGLV
jgi:pimeloyl-ACP methyl ester carboxylesterase